MKDQINKKFSAEENKEKKGSLIISKFNIKINQTNLRLAIVGSASYAIRDDNYKLGIILPQSTQQIYLRG